MKYVILILVFMLSICCSKSKEELKKEKAYRQEKDITYATILWASKYTFRDGDCEYLVMMHGYKAIATHKGDCTNSIHIYNK